MDTEERAVLLGQISERRLALKPLRNGMANMLEQVAGWIDGRQPSRRDLVKSAEGFTSGDQALDEFERVLDEFERLVLLERTTDSPFDDAPPGADDPEEAARASADMLDSMERALVGAHTAFRGISTLLTSLAQGQTLTPEQYREKAAMILPLAQDADDSLRHLRALRRMLNKLEGG